MPIMVGILMIGSQWGLTFYFLAIPLSIGIPISNLVLLGLPANLNIEP